MADEMEMATECWMRARQQAGELLDEPDFCVATGFAYMSSYSNAVGDFQRGKYYSSIAETMCEHIGQTFSQTYLACLGSVLLYPFFFVFTFYLFLICFFFLCLILVIYLLFFTFICYLLFILLP